MLDKLIIMKYVPSKHDALNQCWLNVVPPSTTSAQQSPLSLYLIIVFACNSELPLTHGMLV